jgi:hypothetical protein
MLVVAGFAQPANIGRYINLGAGFALCLLGAGLYRLHQRFMSRTEAENNAKAALDSEKIGKAVG